MSMTINQGFKEGGDEGDLFRGTASYYARFRRPYPPEVVSYVVRTFGLDGRGRLMDGGCGTGQAFLVLANYFAEVVAFDPDPQMVDYSRRFAAERGLANVTVLQMKAEELGPQLGTFRMVIFAASFHWTDRFRVAELVYDRLDPGGHLVLFAPSGVHAGATPWEAEVQATLAYWLGPERRAGGGVYKQRERHAEVLARTRFRPTTTTDLYVEEEWTVDELIGYLFSTSYASKEILGDKADAFEGDLRARLLRLVPTGRFVKTIEYTVIAAEK